MQWVQGAQFDERRSRYGSAGSPVSSAQGFLGRSFHVTRWLRVWDDAGWTSDGSSLEYERHAARRTAPVNGIGERPGTGRRAGLNWGESHGVDPAVERRRPELSPHQMTPS